MGYSEVVIAYDKWTEWQLILKELNEKSMGTTEIVAPERCRKGLSSASKVRTIS